MSPQAPPTIELDQAEFETQCAELTHASRDFDADAIVGIATGGVHVARAMCLAWEGEVPMVVEISMRRPATEIKERMKIGKVLGGLPEPVVNRLRWVEVELRERALRSGTELDARATAELRGQIPEETRMRLAERRRVLVVDDTVDSGRTLAGACQVIESIAPHAEIRTAVLTSTWRRPPVRPDYSLHDRVLIRFPWSFDS